MILKFRGAREMVESQITNFLFFAKMGGIHADY